MVDYRLMIAKLKSLKNHQGFMKYFKNTSWLFVAFATLGLDGIVVREVIKNETKTAELIGTAFVFI